MIGELTLEEALDTFTAVGSNINADWQRGPVVISNKAIDESYQHWAKKNGAHSEHLSSVVKKLRWLLGGKLPDTKPSVDGKRVYSKKLPSLKNCREAFEKVIRHKVDWNN